MLAAQVISLDGPGSVRVERVPLPVPDEGQVNGAVAACRSSSRGQDTHLRRTQVLVKVASSSVCPVDILVTAGKMGPVKLPKVIGGDIAGTVVGEGRQVCQLEALPWSPRADLGLVSRTVQEGRQGGLLSCCTSSSDPLTHHAAQVYALESTFFPNQSEGTQRPGRPVCHCTRADKTGAQEHTLSTWLVRLESAAQP